VPTNNVLIAAAGSDPTVTVIIGQSQKGKYRVALTCKGAGEKEVARNASDSNLADTFSLGPAASLNGCLLSWDIDIASAAEEPNQKYSASVHISQDGSLVENGLFEYDGQLDRFVSVVDIIRLQTS
jgi:hypothetical protein